MNFLLFMFLYQYKWSDIHQYLALLWRYIDTSYLLTYLLTYLFTDLLTY